MENPIVTISFVVFNQAPYLRAALDSCLMQKVDFNYEIIIHDDCSTDNSAEIIKEYAHAHPDIIFPIIQTENQFSKGTEINAQIIIPKARGKYIAYLEADDYWVDPNKLQMQKDFMESHPDVSMCFTATRRMKPNNPNDYKIRRYANYDSNIPPKDVILIGGSLVDMGSAMTKKSIFNEIPEWYHYTQMWDNTIPLLSMLDGQIYYLNHVTAAYRENTPGSYTQLNVRAIEKRKFHILKTLKLLEGFDQATKYKYQEIINRKIRVISNGLLLLLDPEDENFRKYYSQLTPGLKLEYQLFKRIGNYTLWKKYRYLLSNFRKIKYV